ncbi:hypothetical protein HpNP55_14940 [Helicobacter pylori]
MVQNKKPPKKRGFKREGSKEKGFFIKIPQKRKRVQEQRVQKKKSLKKGSSKKEGSKKLNPSKKKLQKKSLKKGVPQKT